MQLPPTSAVETFFEDGWLTLWFNRPENRNALGRDLSSDLTEILLAIRPRRDVRGITLRGRGGVFCAGGDLKSFNASASGGETMESISAMSRAGAELFDLVNTTPQVVIALVEGAAMAGGLGLACCADVVICEDNSTFAFTETMIGLAPAQISPIVLARLGAARGRRLMLTAARFNGREAVTLGLADFSAPGADAMETIEKQIRSQVLKCAPGAIAATKDLILAIPSMSRREQADAAGRTFAGLMLSEEGREGLAAFAAKRRPDWQER